MAWHFDPRKAELINKTASYYLWPECGCLEFAVYIMMRSSELWEPNFDRRLWWVFTLIFVLGRAHNTHLRCRLFISDIWPDIIIRAIWFILKYFIETFTSRFPAYESHGIGTVKRHHLLNGSHRLAGHHKIGTNTINCQINQRLLRRRSSHCFYMTTACVLCILIRFGLFLN